MSVPFHQLTPHAAAMLSLYVRYLNDALNEVVYTAEMAEIYFDARVTRGLGGIELEFSGFDDKLHVLVERVLGDLVPPALTDGPSEVERVRFASVKERAVRSYKNYLFKPNKHATYIRVQKLSKWGHHVDAQLRHAEGASFRETAETVRALFCEGVSMETIVLGNLTRSSALHLAESIDGVLSQMSSRADARLPVATVVPQGEPMRIDADGRNPDDTNSAVEVYYQIGPQNERGNCLIDVVEKLMEEPIFDELRTKQGLGYDVSCGSRLTRQCPGFCMRLATSKHTAERACESFREFAETFFVDFLSALPEDTYRSSVEGLVSDLREPDHCLGDAWSRLWHEMRDGTYDWDQREREAAALQRMLDERPRGGLSDVIDF